MNFVHAVAEIVAVHNGVRHDAGSPHDGPTGYLARNLFDQLQAIQSISETVSSLAMFLLSLLS